MAGRPEWEVLANGELFVIFDDGRPIALGDEKPRETLNVILDWPLLVQK